MQCLCVIVATLWRLAGPALAFGSTVAYNPKHAYALSPKLLTRETCSIDLNSPTAFRRSTMARAVLLPTHGICPICRTVAVLRSMGFAPALGLFGAIGSTVARVAGSSAKP